MGGETRKNRPQAVMHTNLPTIPEEMIEEAFKRCQTQRRKHNGSFLYGHDGYLSVGGGAPKKYAYVCLENEAMPEPARGATRASLAFLKHGETQYVALRFGTGERLLIRKHTTALIDGSQYGRNAVREILGEGGKAWLKLRGVQDGTVLFEVITKMEGTHGRS